MRYQGYVRQFQVATRRNIVLSQEDIREAYNLNIDPTALACQNDEQAARNAAFAASIF